MLRIASLSAAALLLALAASPAPAEDMHNAPQNRTMREIAALQQQSDNRAAASVAGASAKASPQQAGLPIPAPSCLGPIDSASAGCER